MSTKYVSYLNRSLTSALLFSAALVVALASCQKAKKRKVLEELYETYSDGEISECKYLGKPHYMAGILAYDAGTVVYDHNGEMVGECNYAWGQVDAICGDLEGCKVVYRNGDNILGKPAVDEYGLGD